MKEIWIDLYGCRTCGSTGIKRLLKEKDLSEKARKLLVLALDYTVLYASSKSLEHAYDFETGQYFIYIKGPLQMNL